MRSSWQRIVVWLLLVASSVRGAEPEAGAPSFDRPWQISSFAAAAEVSHQRVFDLAFSADGRVWFAAADGLRCFDGYRWQSFGKKDGLPSDRLRAVHFSARGELWVSCEGGVGVFDPVLKSFDPRGAREGLPNQSVRQIVEDADGTLWFCCDQWPDISVKPGGLARLRDGKWTTFTREHGLPMNYVLACFRDARGRQFASTPNGWVQYDGARWVTPLAPGSQAEKIVVQFAESGDGTLFALGEQRLLTLRDEAWRDAGAETVLVGTRRDGEAVALQRDVARNTAWFAQWDGRQFVRRSALALCPTGSRFYRLKQAPDGAIWAVGYGTILRWSAEAGPWTHYERLPTPLLHDGRDRVWFGDARRTLWHDGGGFHRLDGIGTLLGIDHDGAAIGVDEAGHLIVAPAAAPDRTETTNLGFARVSVSVLDRQGTFWIGGPGLGGEMLFAYRDGGAWRRFEAPELKGYRFNSAQPGLREGMWVMLPAAASADYAVVHVTRLGVAPLDLGSSRPPLPFATLNEFENLYTLRGYPGYYWRPRDGSLPWQRVRESPASGFGQGVLSADGELVNVFQGAEPGYIVFRGGRWSLHHGDFDRADFGVDGKTLYLGARGGLHIRRQSGSTDLDFLPLPDDGFVQRVVDSGDGTLWIGTSDGVLRYRRNTTPPAVELTLATREVPTGHALAAAAAGMHRFAAAPMPAAFRYSWQIDDGAWTPFESGAQRALPTTTLAPGEHRLLVRARDVDGNASAASTPVSFTVLPVPLQSRAWFGSAVAVLSLVMLALVWLGVKRTRQVASTNVALRAEIAERRRAEEALEQARAQLEQRVAMRTAELSHANASLRTEILERQAADEQNRRLEEQLRQAQKMQAIGTLAGGIAHDFNNILTVILPSAKLALMEPGVAEPVREHLHQILTAGNRARDLVRQILAFSRRHHPVRQSVDLRSIVEETQRLVRAGVPASIEVVAECDADLPPVLADATQIHQVLMNLCTNAAHALRDRTGRLAISARAVELSATDAARLPNLRPGRHVCLAVQDNGTGMTPEVRRRIFEPFFTTKTPAEGTGLGLAVVHGIVRDHDGAIAVESTPGAGSRFEIYLPSSNTFAATISPEPEKIPHGSGERILVVDDDATVLRVVGATLRQIGYDASLHQSPSDALAAFSAGPSAFALVITDLTMPEMLGPELAARVLKVRPDVPILMATGFGGAWTPSPDEAARFKRILHKPLEPVVLARAIRDTIAPERG